MMNDIVFFGLLPLIAVFFLVKRLRRKPEPKQVHAPHSPQTPNDPKYIVRSKGAGYADGGE